MSQLRPTDCVFLHALLEGGDKRVTFMRSAPSDVAPNEAYYWHMVGWLERRGVLVSVAIANAAEGYGRSAHGVVRRHELCPGLPPPSELRASIEGHLERTRADRASQAAYALLWRELALAELEAYIEWELASHRFEAGWSGALLDVMDEGLLSFSIGQMFYFCWTAVRDLASHHLRNPAPFETYKGYLLNAFSAKVKRAKRDGWEVRQYSRQWRRGPSAVAETFSNHATTLGERFLLEVPSSEALASLF